MTTKPRWGYGRRYIDRSLSYKVKKADMITGLEGFSSLQLKKILRMVTLSFLKFVGLVFGHAIFCSASYKEQEEVAVQVVITPDRLGHGFQVLLIV